MQVFHPGRLGTDVSLVDRVVLHLLSVDLGQHALGLALMAGQLMLLVPSAQLDLIADKFSLG